MSPIVRVVTDKESDAEVFVSLEQALLVLGDVRATLPQLREQLRQKWDVTNVQIQDRIPRLRNPLNPLQVVEAACIGLVVSFTVPAVRAAGKKIGDAIGDEIAKHVRRWIRAIGKPRSARSTRSKRNRNTRSHKKP